MTFSCHPISVRVWATTSITINHDCNYNQTFSSHFWHLLAALVTEMANLNCCGIHYTFKVAHNCIFGDTSRILWWQKVYKHRKYNSRLFVPGGRRWARIILYNRYQVKQGTHFFSRASPKAGRELQTELNTRRIMEGWWTLSGAGAGHRAVSLHRDCVLVFQNIDGTDCCQQWAQYFSI